MPWNVFYSYSHKDADLRDRLGTLLAPLKYQKKIVEWHDRRIEPGGDWQSDIAAQLDSAHLIVLLVSPDFLASEYCFGVEMERAFGRLKRGEVKLVPVLIKPCLWEESRFRELQLLPRDARPITSSSSVDDALAGVANEIRTLVSEPPPAKADPSGAAQKASEFNRSLGMVRGQVRAYARLYERTRQRMVASDLRTSRMQQIFEKMIALATASYPLIDDLVVSPSPGERLAAVAILQMLASEAYLPFLVQVVATEKPFVGYHAVTALRFAVEGLDPRSYAPLREAMRDAEAALDVAGVSATSDRRAVLSGAVEALRVTTESLSLPTVARD